MYHKDNLHFKMFKCTTIYSNTEISNRLTSISHITSARSTLPTGDFSVLHCCDVIDCNGIYFLFTFHGEVI